MTPNQLRSFVAVAETGSVQEAARCLFVTQPAVSAILASLQRELGVRLVERDGRGLRLTAAGTVLASYGRRVLGLLEEAAVATVASADPEHGRLRLVAVTTAGEHVVPGVLASFRAAHPGVEIVLEVGNRERLWSLLSTGEVDLAIGGRPPPGGELVSLAEADNDLVIVSAPRSGRAPVADEELLAELAIRPWLVRELGSGTRATAEELFEQLGISPTRLTLGSNGALRESTIVGLGITLISRAAVERQLEEGTLEEWSIGPLPLKRPWNLVARSGRALPATAALFVDHLLDTGSFRALPRSGTSPGLRAANNARARRSPR